MESMDDDFDDLYADVEVQASSAVGEPEENNPGNGSKSTEVDNKFIAGSVTEDSDSEDDLNIVLNDDDDCQNFPVTGARSHGGSYEENENGDFGVDETGSDNISRRVEPFSDGSELKFRGDGVEIGIGAKIEVNSLFKYVRPHGSSFPSNIRVNGHTGVLSFSYKSRRGDWEDDVYNQNKVATMKSLPHQFGHCFSLPWYRTILDVNIDAFEEKPWRHASADITDFFNYGFNEDSWKEYCNSLEKLGQQTSRQARIPSHYSSKLDQAYEAEAGHEIITREAITEDVAEVDSSLKCADRGAMLLELPKGRAIKVEDSINERQPSMDIRRPRFQDSGVIIEDSTVDSSDSANEELGHGSKSKVLESGKLDAKDDRNVCFSVSASSEELNEEHYARARNVSTSSFERSLQPASNQTSLETSDHGKAYVSDMNGGCHQNMEVHISEGTAEAMATKNKENEAACRNTHHSHTYVIETEPSLENRSHFSPTLSFSGSDPEDSVDAASIEIRSPLRRKEPGYGTGLQKSLDHKSSRSDGPKMKLNDGEGFSEHTTPMKDKQKHESWRHQHSLKQRIVVESDDEYDPYPISDVEGDWKRYRRDGNPTEEEWKHHRGRPHGIIDQKIYPKTAMKLPFYQMRGNSIIKITHLFTVAGRRKDWEKEPCVNRSKRFTDSHLWALGRKAHLRFKKDSDHFGQRLPAQKSLVPHTCRESGSLASRYSSASTERDIQWRRGSERLQLRKKTDHGDYPLDYKHEDEWLKLKYDSSISFTRCERGLVKSYERCIPPIRREVKVSGREGRFVDAALFHLNRSGTVESEVVCQRQVYSRSLALAIDIELSAHNGRRWFNAASPRNEASESLIERCHRHQRIDNEVQSWGRGRSKRSRVLHWREDKLLVNDRLFAQWVSFSCEKTSKHDSIHATLGSLQDEVFNNDSMLEHHGYEMISEGSNATCFKRKSFIRYRGENEQVVLKDRDSVDLIVVERKVKLGKPRSRKSCIICTYLLQSFRRHSDSRNLVCKARVVKMGSEYPTERKAVMEFHDSYGSKTADKDNRNKNGRRNNNEKQFGKFSVTECNKYLDIEEGQIIHEKQSVEDINPEKENASETMIQRGKAKMRTLLVDSAFDKNGAVGEYENKRILETLAKMEKGRERFRDPITIKREQDKTSTPQVELVVQTNETKRQRPARKRQWGVS
ncbi:FIP1[V]-like protein [Gossypium raimondii]|uniref:FIP1[V]-like protein n=1 Tax=Gossypium raimondii TaxID=29730 RepID=UPI00227A206C|nr:FIP1[V]-like protein [Gossypium raimondii]